MNNSSHMNRRSRMISRYLLAVLFILLVSSRQVSDSFINMIQESNFSTSTSQILYSVAAVLIFSFFYYMLTCGKRGEDEQEEENFLFIPTPKEDKILGLNYPRDAVYKDKAGVTFNFDSVGSGMCSSANCHDDGIIKGCPGRYNLYGEGEAPRFM